MSTIETELLTGFLSEARNYVAAMQKALLNYDSASDQPQLEAILGPATILSGAAGMLELDEVADLARSIIGVLQPLVEANAVLAEADQHMLDETLGQLELYLVTPLEAAEPVSSPDKQPSTRPAVVSPAASQLADGRSLLPDLPPELIEIFVLEAKEHSQALEHGLEGLRKKPDDLNLMSDMRRTMHTLKGAAASVGFAQMARLAHLMEELLEQFLEGEHGELPRQALELLFDSAGVLDNLLNPNQPGLIGESFEVIDQRYVEVLGPAYPPAAGGASPAQSASDETLLQQTTQVEDMLRLSLASMDLLINRVGEIIINRSGLDRQLGALRELLVEVDHSARRLRQVAQEIDAQIEITLPETTRHTETADTLFDPLELDRYSLLYQLTRELEEISADTDNINTQLRFLAGDLDVGLTRERHLTSELQDELLATRLVPFYELETRLRRIVHRTARDVGKEVELVLIGFDTKVDKTILDTLADPLMHLLRNAVDHGIEAPDVRRAANKTAQGTVTLAVKREHGRIVVSLADDGAGIDLDYVYRRAVAAGIVAADDRLSEQQLLDLLFQEGFSLSETVTQTSGRGVGLDIVRREVHRAQGTVRISNTLGYGVTFTISVPVTLAITEAIFIKSGDTEYAIPLEQVAVIIRLEADLIEDINRDGVLRYDGRMLATYDLFEFTQKPDGNQETPRYGLIVEGNEQAVVVLVNGQAGIHEIVVKSLGSHLRRVPGIVGATITGDGSVTLILDLIEIIGLRDAATTHTSGEAPFTPAPQVASVPRVLVVDDSVSVRRVLSSFLQRMGWQTTEARDGIDALEKLDAEHPDVALVDIEMPRMNGYELLSRIKSDPVLSSLPVVFLTSRSAAKHRDRATALGVDGYLVKPYNENELINELTRVMRRARKSVR